MKENEWKKIINKFNSSGKTKAQWCKENNINIKTFSRWFLYFNKKDEDTKITEIPLRKNSNSQKCSDNFVEVEIYKPQEKNIPSNSSIVVTIGKATVEIKENFNKDLFKEVIQSLTESC